MLVQWLGSISPLFLSFKIDFSQRQLPSLHVGSSFLTQMQSSQVKPKAKTKSHNNLLLNQSIKQNTSVSYMFQYACSHKIGWSDTKGDMY